MTSLQSGKFYKDGYQIVLDNAKRLAKIADRSAEENEFGIACSLNILSAEESIKAICLIIKHYNLDSEFKDFEKVFKDHKTKHEFLSETSSVIPTVIEIMYTDYGIFNYIFEMFHRLSNEIPESEREEFMDKIKPFLDFIEPLQKLNDNKINIEESKEWWTKANLEKNRGLYVDIVDGTWHDPRSFTKDKYLESKKHTYSMIENADKMADLLNKPSENLSQRGLHSRALCESETPMQNELATKKSVVLSSSRVSC